MGGVLVGVLVVSALVALAAFVRGDQARRRAQGLAGPRPSPSIGEAVRVALQRPGGRALVLFLGADPASAEAGRALAEDPAVVQLLSEPSLTYAVVRSTDDERDVAELLFQKYAGQPLPAGRPACLLLDGRAQTLAKALELGPLTTWLGPWLSAAPSAPVTPEAPRSS